MAVLIKGMEMPESCWKCPFMYARVYCVVNSKLIFDDDEYSELNKRYDGCPLAEVPESHGRLIDADAFAKDLEYDVELDLRALCGGDCDGSVRDQVQFDKDCKQNCMWFVSEAPTIIPAEEGK